MTAIYTMKTIPHKKLNSVFHKASALLVVVAFLVNTVLPSQAQSVSNMPSPGTVIPSSLAYSPVLIKGVTLDLNNPFLFDFIIHPGDSGLQGEKLKDQTNKLIKYFLASLTTPENQMWVNLSPYEKDRIIPQGLGKTEMGHDMLAQDYILKQITASLMYPDNKFGSEFWKRIYQRAQEKYRTTEIPMNTFNKVWIVPDKAVIYENGTTAVIIESHLKVMLEEDYLALEMNQGSTKHGLGNVTNDDLKVVSGVSSEVIREIIIPELEREVNYGKTFADLRQISNSVILATWYKNKVTGSILQQIYIDRGKTAGIETTDKEINLKIYKQYIEAFKKGVYNLVKEDYDPITQEIIPRKYFSGGERLEWSNKTGTDKSASARTRARREISGSFRAKTEIVPVDGDAATLVDTTKFQYDKKAWKKKGALTLSDNYRGRFLGLVNPSHPDVPPGWKSTPNVSLVALIPGEVLRQSKNYREMRQAIEGSELLKHKVSFSDEEKSIFPLKADIQKMI